MIVIRSMRKVLLEQLPDEPSIEQLTNQRRTVNRVDRVVLQLVPDPVLDRDAVTLFPAS
jgi:hypothetical protein